MATHSNKTLSNAVPMLLSPNGTHSGVDLIIQNLSTSGYVYVGGENVSSTSFGYRIDAESAFGMTVPPKESLYAIAQINGTPVAIIESGLVQ